MLRTPKNKKELIDELNKERDFNVLGDHQQILVGLNFQIAFSPNPHRCTMVPYKQLIYWPHQ